MFGLFLVLMSIFGLFMNMNSIMNIIYLINLCTGAYLMNTAYKKTYKPKLEKHRQKVEAERAEKERIKAKKLEDERRLSDTKQLNAKEEAKRKMREIRKHVSKSCDLLTLLDKCGVSSANEMLKNVISYAETLDPAGIKSSAKVKQGDSVYLGAYNRSGGTKTPIEWIVVDVSGNQGLLVSRNIIDDRPFQTTGSTLSWEQSEIRKWLNGDFYEVAFIDEEKRQIANKAISNGKQQGYEKWTTSQYRDASTYDNVFLLSYYEVAQYLRPTFEQLHIVNNQSWWLRSPGHSDTYASFINSNGGIEDEYIYLSIYGSRYNTPKTKGVRPAVWVNLDSTFFHA